VPSIEEDGGYLLIYELDTKKSSADRETLKSLAAALKMRLDPSGRRGVIVKPHGNSQVKIIIPGDDLYLIRDRRTIETAGYLQFRIVADDIKHDYIVERARHTSQLRETIVRDEDQMPIGKWVRVQHGNETSDGVYQLRVQVWNDFIRDADSKEEIKIDPVRDLHELPNADVRFGKRKVLFEAFLAEDYERKDGLGSGSGAKAGMSNLTRWIIIGVVGATALFIATEVTEDSENVSSPL